MVKGKWDSEGLYIFGGSIVGVVTETNGRWFAYGCLFDWRDTRIGTFSTQKDARVAVETWAKE